MAHSVTMTLRSTLCTYDLRIQNTTTASEHSRSTVCSPCTNQRSVGDSSWRRRRREQGRGRASEKRSRLSADQELNLRAQPLGQLLRRQHRQFVQGHLGQAAHDSSARGGGAPQLGELHLALRPCGASRQRGSCSRLLVQRVALLRLHGAVGARHDDCTGAASAHCRARSHAGTHCSQASQAPAPAPPTPAAGPGAARRRRPGHSPAPQSED